MNTANQNQNFKKMGKTLKFVTSRTIFQINFHFFQHFIHPLVSMHLIRHFLIKIDPIIFIKIPPFVKIVFVLQNKSVLANT